MTSGPDAAYERQATSAGWKAVAGIDEAGRGPLAGPVIAAAVILPSPFSLPGLTDSKKVTASRRDHLFRKLTTLPSIQWATGRSDPEEIDGLNILQATWLAMARAVQALPSPADFCLVDGLPVKNFPLPHQAIVKGDSLCLSIAAASIIAKVTRDRLMAEADLQFPVYGFSRHKGYGTKAHLESLRAHGPCPLHRKSFSPVAQLTLPLD